MNRPSYEGPARRRGAIAEGIRRLVKENRDKMLIAVQNYWLRVTLIPNSLKRALRELQSDYADILVFSTPSETKSKGYQCRTSEKWRVGKEKAEQDKFVRSASF